MNNYPNLLEIYEDSTEYLVADPSLRIEGYWQRSITESFNSMQLDTDDYFDRSSYSGYTVSYMYKGTKLTVEQAKTQFPEFFI